MAELIAGYWWVGVFIVSVAVTALVIMPWLKKRQQTPDEHEDGP